MCLPAPTAGRCEERTKVKGEGRSERSRSKSRHLLTPTRFPHAMPFVWAHAAQWHINGASKQYILRWTRAVFPGCCPGYVSATDMHTQKWQRFLQQPEWGAIVCTPASNLVNACVTDMRQQKRFGTVITMRTGTVAHGTLAQYLVDFLRPHFTTA